MGCHEISTPGVKQPGVVSWRCGVKARQKSSCLFGFATADDLRPLRVAEHGAGGDGVGGGRRWRLGGESRRLLWRANQVYVVRVHDLADRHVLVVDVDSRAGVGEVRARRHVGLVR